MSKEKLQNSRFHYDSPEAEAIASFSTLLTKSESPDLQLELKNIEKLLSSNDALTGDAKFYLDNAAIALSTGNTADIAVVFFHLGSFLSFTDAKRQSRLKSDAIFEMLDDYFSELKQKKEKQMSGLKKQDEIDNYIKEVAYLAAEEHWPTAIERDDYPIDVAEHVLKGLKIMATTLKEKLPYPIPPEQIKRSAIIHAIDKRLNDSDRKKVLKVHTLRNWLRESPTIPEELKNKRGRRKMHNK